MKKILLYKTISTIYDFLPNVFLMLLCFTIILCVIFSKFTIKEDTQFIAFSLNIKTRQIKKLIALSFGDKYKIISFKSSLYFTEVIIVLYDKLSKCMPYITNIKHIKDSIDINHYRYILLSSEDNLQKFEISFYHASQRGSQLDCYPKFTPRKYFMLDKNLIWHSWESISFPVSITYKCMNEINASSNYAQIENLDLNSTDFNHLENYVKNQDSPHEHLQYYFIEKKTKQINTQILHKMSKANIFIFLVKKNINDGYDNDISKIDFINGFLFYYSNNGSENIYRLMYK